jgi:hypothetical protein
MFNRRTSKPEYGFDRLLPSEKGEILIAASLSEPEWHP